MEARSTETATVKEGRKRRREERRERKKYKGRKPLSTFDAGRIYSRAVDIITETVRFLKTAARALTASKYQQRPFLRLAAKPTLLM